MNPQHSILFGTCSWNYPSWKGLVYSAARRTAIEYLPEYAARFRTAEIDSWFYRMPSRVQVASYAESVDPEFRFTCKVPCDITLAFKISQSGGAPEPNPDFLSAVKFEEFLAVTEPLHGRLAAIMLEFEYLNQLKMPSREAFLERLTAFLARVSRTIPIAIETRNGNYLSPEYFDCINTHDLVHVFSEKQFMPHVYDVYDRYGYPSGRPAIVRLLGGDRKTIEKATGDRWDQIVDEKPDRKEIAKMILSLSRTGAVIVNVNNHYEGSAPKTIAALIEAVAARDSAESVVASASRSGAIVLPGRI